MKLVGYILFACVLLAILQSLAFVASVLGLMALFWCVCFRTRETFGLIGALLLFGIAAQSPGPCLHCPACRAPAASAGGAAGPRPGVQSGPLVAVSGRGIAALSRWCRDAPRGRLGQGRFRWRRRSW